MRRASALLLLCLAGLCGAGPPSCASDEEMAALVARKHELETAYVPKREFWDAVARKGEAIKEQQALRAEIETVEAEAGTAAAATLEARRSQVAKARSQREQAAQALRQAEEQREKARSEAAVRRAVLDAFAARGRAGDGS